MNRVVHRLVDRLIPVDPSMPDPNGRRTELIRETSVMVLYVAVVLLATLTALPTDYGTTGAAGTRGPSVLVILWGTTVGLALAHWFAFRLATSALGGGRPSQHDVSLGVAQLLGACLVAVTSSIVIAITPPESDMRAALFVPAAFIGVAGYGVARSAGRSKTRSALVGAVVLAMGLAIAVFKAALSAH